MFATGIRTTVCIRRYSIKCPYLSVAIALDDSGQLTDPLGIKMAEFPLNPMYARMLLLSGTQSINIIINIIIKDTFGCSEEILTITAMLQVNQAFHQPTRMKSNAVNIISIQTSYTIVCLIDASKKIILCV